VVGGLLDAGNIRVDFLRAAGGFLDAAGNLLGRRSLFFDRGRDRNADLIDSAITSATLRIAVTVASLEVWIAAICSDISVVAFAVWPASDLTSDATTAKPRPASPARAASMVALSASRLVCAAMLWINVTTSPIFCAPSASERALSPVAAGVSRRRAPRFR